MKTIIYTTLFCALSACSAPDAPQVEETQMPIKDKLPALEDLAGSEWNWPEHEGVFIHFDAEGRVVGSGGCNRFSGRYAYGPANGLIAIGPLAATRMACPGPAMQIEQDFFNRLEKARRYSATHTKLTLRPDDDTPALELNRSDWD